MKKKNRNKIKKICRNTGCNNPASRYSVCHECLTANKTESKTPDAKEQSATVAGYVPRFCLCEIILYDNQTGKEHVLGGGFNSDSIMVIENELVKAVNKIGKI